MADWDDPAPELERNLARLIPALKRDAENPVMPDAAMVKGWYTILMRTLVPHDDTPLDYARWFRGEGSLAGYDVEVAGCPGVESADVERAVGDFFAVLLGEIQVIESMVLDLKRGKIDENTYAQHVITLCGWAHAEWVRIHPFANGNGRTARCWVIYLCHRLGVDQFIHIRPRPAMTRFADAARAAMSGGADGSGDGGIATITLFQQMYADAQLE